MAIVDPITDYVLFMIYLELSNRSIKSPVTFREKRALQKDTTPGIIRRESKEGSSMTGRSSINILNKVCTQFKEDSSNTYELPTFRHKLPKTGGLSILVLSLIQIYLSST